MIFGGTQHNPSELGSALVGTKIVWSQTEKISATASDVLIFAAKIRLSFLSPNLSAYLSVFIYK